MVWASVPVTSLSGQFRRDGGADVGDDLVGSVGVHDRVEVVGAVEARGRVGGLIVGQGGKQLVVAVGDRGVVVLSVDGRRRACVLPVDLDRRIGLRGVDGDRAIDLRGVLGGRGGRL